jgi:transketolase C-terminal domain/subunit
MKTLKRALLALLAILIALLVIAVFTPTDYAVTRSIEIARNQAEVFDYIRLLRNQDNFSKWAQMDPAMEKSYIGEDGTPGFVSSWKSKNSEVGTGEQEIISIEEGKAIYYELRFLEPFTSVASTHLELEALDDTTTRVLWGFAGTMPYPSNLFLLFVNMEKMLADDFDTGLQNLKKILETKS